MSVATSTLSRTPFAVAALASLVLAGCGGGGGGGDTSPVQPTPLPELSITAPASGDVAQAVPLGTSATIASGLKARWEFGDGSSSTELAPRHSYVKAGDYEIHLTITNEAGQTREYKTSIALSRPGIVKGLNCSKAEEKGWCWQQPSPTGNPSYGLAFADGKTGWRVGEEGEIFKTSDGGAGWSLQHKKSDLRLVAVRAVSSNEVWVFGEKWLQDENVLLHTSDGGRSWTQATAPGLFGISHLYFGRLSQDHYTISHVYPNGGLLVKIWNARWGTRPGFRYTADGGASWSTPDVLGDGIVTDKGTLLTHANGEIFRANPSQGTSRVVLNLKAAGGMAGGYDVHWSSSGGVIWAVQASTSTASDKPLPITYVSQDDGLTWRIQDALSTKGAPFGGVYADLVAAMDGGQRLLAIAFGHPVRSLDGGRTWIWDQSLPPSFALSSNCASTGDRLICSTYDGRSYGVTKDLGATWDLKSMPDAVRNYRDTAFERLEALPDGALVFVAGGMGPDFVLSADGRWTQVADRHRFHSPTVVSFASAQQGYLFGADGKFYGSQNGGQSWSLLGLPSVGIKPGRMDVANQVWSPASLAAWGKDRLGVVDGDGQLWLSPDKGQSWSVFNGTPAQRWGSLRAQDEQFLWVVPPLCGGLISDVRQCPSSLTSAVLLSDDAGAHWKAVQVPLKVPAAVYRSASGRLTIVGEEGRVQQSDDGGLRWIERATPSKSSLFGLHSVDGKQLWAVGVDGLMVSRDEGVTWTSSGLPGHFLDVRFADAQHGWVVGHDGQIHATRDGGTTWERQESGTKQDLYRLEVLDSRTVWAIGMWGAVLATGTGGL